MLMHPGRRACLMALPGALALPGATWGQTDAADDAVRPDRALRFPRDHGAHPGSRIEWWYITGWLTSGTTGDEGLMGFQLTFFRSRTGLGAGLVGHLVPRQLLFAHAAITELKPGGHRHAQRMSRWSEDERDAGPVAGRADTQLRLGAWRLQRHAAAEGSRFDARLAAPEAGFTLDLALTSTQPLLLQGAQGYSLKGPPVAPGQPAHASLYYSMPQLAVQGAVTLGGRDHAVQGRAWLDHEWSDALMPAGAVGWDWIGINLTDGGALTAFVLRAADGRALWAGGSYRSAAGLLRTFAAHEVAFAALRHWDSPETGARYPVRWRVTTPAGTHEVEALLDAQELDSRRSTGSAYWEGLSALRDAGSGLRVGLGYLEMTGYAGALRLG